MMKSRGVQNDSKGIEMIKHLFYFQYQIYFQNQFQSGQQNNKLLILVTYRNILFFKATSKKYKHIN